MTTEGSGRNWGAAGLALGVFSLTGNVTGIVVSMARLLILFCQWVAWVGLLDGRRVQ